MKAVEATAEQLEADGSCEPQQLFAVDPPAGTAGGTDTTSTGGDSTSGTTTAEGSGVDTTPDPMG